MTADIPHDSSPIAIPANSPASEQLIENLAHFYSRARGEEFPDLEGFQHWIAGGFHELPIQSEFVGYDPYRNLEEMKVDMNSTGILKISTRNNDSVLDPEVNLMFRAVHDYDHILYGYDFDGAGELQACRAISNRCGDELGRAFLFSEIAAQACVALVNGDFEQQKYVRYPLKIRDQALRRA